MTNTKYDGIGVAHLKKMLEELDISHRGTKEDMITVLISHDNGKYIREMTNEKQPDGTILIGIDIRDQYHLIEIGRLMEKGIAKRIGLYCNNRAHYNSQQRLI